jgi:hypothetical protein
MRKRIIRKLAQMYTRTFPPLTPNGNNVFGDAKRFIIAILMGLVGGRNTEKIIREVLTEYKEWYELNFKGDLA